MKKQTEDKEFLLRFGARVNLGRILDYKRHAGIALDAAAKRWESTRISDADHLAGKMRTDFKALLNQSVFLMIFGYLEELLFIIAKTRGIDLPDRTAGLSKYKHLVKKLLSADLSCLDSWEFLRDAAIIRNAFLHAAGRVDFMRNPENLRGVVRKHAECYVIENSRLKVTAKGVERLENNAEDLVLQLI